MDNYSMGSFSEAISAGEVVRFRIFYAVEAAYLRPRIASVSRFVVCGDTSKSDRFLHHKSSPAITCVGIHHV